jgi:hypothetical protein
MWEHDGEEHIETEALAAVFDSAGGRRTMTIVGKFLCMIGVHRWLHKRNPEGGATYLECERCQKQKDTMSLTDHGGGDAGNFG